LLKKTSGGGRTRPPQRRAVFFQHDCRRPPKVAGHLWGMVTSPKKIGSSQIERPGPLLCDSR
ncbi:MAG TPA: hypothetical protein VKT12_08625, partial [Candidatus Binataceae bacterium]|nr:hypothetical protein [Candidatus Binataceae bacterium]